MRIKVFPIICSLIITAIVVFVSLVFVDEANAAGYGWTSPTVSGSDGTCGAGRTPVTIRLRDYSTGNDISGFIEARNNITGQYYSGNGNTLNIGCINISGGFNAHAAVGGFHEAWVGASGFDPVAIHDNGNTTSHIWLLPTSFGPSIHIQSPSPNSWINYDPNWVVYVVPSPSHSFIELFGFFAWNNTTGTAPCNLCIRGGSFGAGTHNVGALGLPDGWYSFGAWARDALSGGTKGLTAWSEGRFDFGGTQYSSFGIDRTGPINIGRSHSPGLPNSSQQVTFSGWATDSLSGLDWETMYYRLNGGSWAQAGFRDLNGQTTQQNTSFIAGPWPAGTLVEYFTRARDLAGNEADSSINSFTVQASNNRLNVNSTPITGVWISGTQAGTSNNTNYVVNTASAINTTLTADGPIITLGGNAYIFQSWSGCNSTNPATRTCTVSMSGGVTRTVTANYSVYNRLNVNSTPITGIPIAGVWGGTTNYNRTSSSSIIGRIDAPATFISGGNTYQFVSAAGCRNSSGPDNADRFCDVYVTGGGSQNVLFTYTPLNTLNVSSVPITGISITSSGTLGGVTNYTRTSTSTMQSRIDAPATWSSGGNTYQFVSASGCRNSSGPDNADRFCDVYVTGGATQNVVFTYVQLLPNLIVEAVIPTPSPFTVNDSITITTQIRNNRSISIPFSSSFQTRLRARPISGVFAAIGGDRTNNGLNGNTSATWIWPDVYTPSIAGVHEFEVCTDIPWQTNGNITEEIEGFDDNCEVVQINVEDSQPWLKTVRGNVGSQSDIDGVWSPGGCPSTPTNCNATHLVIAEGSIQTFASAKSWLLTNYTGGPSLRTYDRYSKLKDDLSTGACNRTGNTLPNVKGRYVYGSTVNWNSTTGFGGGSCSAFSDPDLKTGAVVFIQGDLNISPSITPFRFEPPIPTVFIVSGSINIARNTTVANGVFIGDRSFTDISGSGATDTQLTVGGSVIAALTSGSLSFGRTYKDALKNPSEIINFDPKYLYLLTDYVGVAHSTFKETNP